MNRLDHICLLTEHNSWIDTKVFMAENALKTAEINPNRGAFLGSIHQIPAKPSQRMV